MGNELAHAVGPTKLQPLSGLHFLTTEYHTRIVTAPLYSSNLEAVPI